MDLVQQAFRQSERLGAPTTVELAQSIEDRNALIDDIEELCDQHLFTSELAQQILGLMHKHSQNFNENHLIHLIADQQKRQLIGE